MSGFVTRSRATSALVVHGLLAALASGQVVSCFSGVKYVRDGEPCASGDQIFEGEVACGGGLRCVPIQFGRNGRRSGLCAPSCDSQTACAANLVCAAGACVRPCSSECGGRYDYSGACCRFPLEGVSACLPAAACDSAKGWRDGGSDDGASSDGELGQ